MAFVKSKALEEAAKLVSQRKLSQAIRLYLSIAEQDPDDLSILNTIGDLCVRDGNTAEALRQFYKLAETYSREGFTLKSIAIYKKIIKLEPTSVDPVLKLAELYSTQGLTHEARQQYAQALAFCQSHSLQEKALQILKKLAAQEPENAASRLRLAEHYEKAGRREDAFQEYLEAASLAHRHRNAALADSALAKARAIDAHNPKLLLVQFRVAAQSGHVEEARRIFAAAPGIEHNAERFAAELIELLGSGALAPASLDLAGEISESVPDSALRIRAMAALAEARQSAGQWSAAAEIYRKLCELDKEQPGWQTALEQALAEQGKTRDSHPAPEPVENPPISQPAVEAGGGAPEEPQPSAGGTESDAVQIDFSEEWKAFTVAHQPEASAAPLPVPEEAPDLGEEKQVIEFYLDHGFAAEARAILEPLAQRYPDNPELLALRLRANEGAQTGAPPAQTPPAGAEPLAAPIGLSPVGGHIEAGLLEQETGSPAAQAEDVALAGYEPQISARPTSESLATSPPGDPDPATGSSGNASTTDRPLLEDLAQDLKSIFEEPEIYTRPAEHELAGGSRPLADGGGISFDDLLAELESGGDSAPPQGTPLEHYNLGVAFHEMGLLDEAIGEFQKVAREASDGQFPPRFLEACSLLGLCFMEKRMPDIAARWYLRALQAPDADRDASVALTYDLASAYECAGNSKAALEKFSEVYSVNIDYRDVAEKIRKLQRRPS